MRCHTLPLLVLTEPVRSMRRDDTASTY